VQGTLGTFIFWALGLPSPLLWGVVMFFLSMIPMAGSFLVWVPAAIYLAATGALGKAAILVVWGVVVIGSIDNFLSPRLVGKRAHLGVDIMVKMLPVWGQKICWALSQFVMLVCCVYIVYGTWLQHEIIKGNASPVAQISMLWVFGVSYVSGTAIGLICLSNLVRLAMGRVDDSELCDVMEEGMSDAEEIAQDMRHQGATATPAGSKP
jgi:hypothetical protein